MKSIDLVLWIKIKLKYNNKKMIKDCSLTIDTKINKIFIIINIIIMITIITIIINNKKDINKNIIQLIPQL